MPVTGCKKEREISQRGQYELGGVGRAYWDMRDAAVLGFVRGGRILDAGCGEGITLEKLVKQFPGAAVQGIDIDPRNVEICRSFGLPARVANIYGTGFPSGEFDSCILVEVIEHLDDARRPLEELARIMKPGGCLVIVYPVDWMMFLARVACFKFREAMFDPGHVRQWTARALGKVLAETGLTVTFSRGLPFRRPFMLHGLVIAEKT